MSQPGQPSYSTHSDLTGFSILKTVSSVLQQCFSILLFDIKPDLKDIKNQLSEISRGSAPASDDSPLQPPEQSANTQLDYLQSEIADLTRQRNAAVGMAERLRAEFLSSNSVQLKTVADAQSEVAELKLQNSRLHSIITKQANNVGEVLDSEIVQAYGLLRAKVQSLVHQCIPIQQIILSPKMHNEPRFFGQQLSQEVFNGILRDRPEEHVVKHRLQAALFKILKHTLLESRLYPVDAETERLLAKLEDQLQTAAGERTIEFLDWRCRTMRCALWLQESSPQLNTAILIMKIFFMPLWWGTSPHTPPRLLKMIQQVCKLAHDLVLMTRQSTAVYAFEVIPRDTLHADEEMPDFTAQDCEGECRDLQTMRVSQTLFGCLAKYPDTARKSAERHVLDKAHVLLY